MNRAIKVRSPLSSICAALCKSSIDNIAGILVTKLGRTRARGFDNCLVLALQAAASVGKGRSQPATVFRPATSGTE
jgi:hypothetical protein